MKTKLTILMLALSSVITRYNSQSTNVSYTSDVIPLGGNFNVGIGISALLTSTADANTAIGFQTMYSNVSGYSNCALGRYSLYYNVNGIDNVAIGDQALIYNDGNSNTAVGHLALSTNTLGNFNTATGAEALKFNTGDKNTAIGWNSLVISTTGSMNTGLGYLSNLGANNYTNSTALGAGAISTADDKVRVGNGAVLVCEAPVTWTSDGRFKFNISEKDVKGLEFIKLLRPVVYNFDTKKFEEFLTQNMSDDLRKEYLNRDFSKSTAIRQSGFIAQEVEKAAEKAGYDFSAVHKPQNANDNYSLGYAHFVVPLVKGMQEQQTMIEQLQQEIAELKKAAGTTGLNETTSDKGFSLGQNIPNPFTHETVVKYTLPQEVRSAYMAVYDLTGKQLTTFDIKEKGNASITLTSEKLAAGIYIYSIVADGKVMDSKRMIVAEK